MSGDAIIYSNLGMALLGEALATAWGIPYGDALSAHVLQPIGLPPAKLAVGGGRSLADLPPGHYAGRPAPTISFHGYAPAAGLIMSAGELGGFLTFCLSKTDHPLRAALRNSMEVRAPAPAYDGGICLGWFVRGQPRARLYWHDGGLAGFSSYLAVAPDSGRAIAIVANDHISTEPIGLALLELNLPPARESRPAR